MHFIWNEILYRPLLNLLLFFYNAVPGHDIGIAIILLTIIVRLIILPSSIKASRSQRKLKVLTPELDKLKEQYKGDQQGLAKAQMDFYKQRGVSPFSSCLPVLIQLPILFALYAVLREGLGHIDPAKVYSFIYLPPNLDTTFLGIIDLAKPEKFVLPVLAGITQYILGKMTMPVSKSTSGGMEQTINKQMMFALPIMTLFFAMSFPAGLALYWVATTVFGIGQQLWVNKEKMKEVKLKIKKKDEGEIVITEAGLGREEKDKQD